MRISATLLALSLLLAATSARADLPPPEGYVEPCTVEQQQRPGLECVACPSSFASRDKCPTQLAPAGFAQVCSTWGASTWTEVWCRAAGGAPATVKDPLPAAGCAPAREHRRGVVAALGLAALAGAWALRRRPRGSSDAAPAAPLRPS
jgi:MYXO-CTERM domain-containing protein